MGLIPRTMNIATNKSGHFFSNNPTDHRRHTVLKQPVYYILFNSKMVWYHFVYRCPYIFFGISMIFSQIIKQIIEVIL